MPKKRPFFAQPIIKWIGSKSFQSKEIIKYFPKFMDTYYEPFCGGCTVLYQFLKSKGHHANRYVCSDINGDLIDLWNTIKRDPQGLFDEYSRMWEEMKNLSTRQDKRKYFEMVREEFNQTRSPYCFFFLMRTCTNGIPRYNKFGNFNNTFHITRDGIRPDRLRKILFDWSETLNEYNVLFRRCDYKDILSTMTLDDFAYLDPPYEMTRSTGKYFGKIDYYDLFDRLRVLTDRGIKFGLSFNNVGEDVVVPGDCFEDQIILTSQNGGYRKTSLKLDNKDVYETFYIN